MLRKHKVAIGVYKSLPTNTLKTVLALMFDKMSPKQICKSITTIYKYRNFYHGADIGNILLKILGKYSAHY